MRQDGTSWRQMASLGGPRRNRHLERSAPLTPPTGDQTEPPPSDRPLLLSAAKIMILPKRSTVLIHIGAMSYTSDTSSPNDTQALV